MRTIEGEALQLCAGLMRACGMPVPKKRKGAPKLDPVRDRFLSGRRPLTPEEVAYALDDQLLDAVACYGPKTLSGVVDLLAYGEHTDAPSGPEFFVLDWGGYDPASCAARREWIRPVLARLRERGLVRLVRRSWVPTKKGYELAGMARWELRRREIAQALAS
jgi:hypothetical protein